MPPPNYFSTAPPPKPNPRSASVGARKKFGVGVWKSEKTSSFDFKNVQKVHKIIFCAMRWKLVQN